MGKDVPLSEDVDTIAELSLHRDVIERVCCEDEPAIKALEALDIDPADQKTLAKIADYQQMGRVSIMELVNTIYRIRGLPRRSDTVSVELVCQGIQEQIQELTSLMTAGPTE